MYFSNKGARRSVVALWLLTSVVPVIPCTFIHQTLTSMYRRLEVFVNKIFVFNGLSSVMYVFVYHLIRHQPPWPLLIWCYLQRLEFLIRDWAFEYEFELGATGGKNYLTKILAVSLNFSLLGKLPFRHCSQCGLPARLINWDIGPSLGSRDYKFVIKGPVFSRIVTRGVIFKISWQIGYIQLSVLPCGWPRLCIVKWKLYLPLTTKCYTTTLNL